MKLIILLWLRFMGHKTVMDYFDHTVLERKTAKSLPNEWHEISSIKHIDKAVAFVAKYFLDEYVIWKMINE